MHTGSFSTCVGEVYLNENVMSKGKMYAAGLKI